MTLVLAMRIVSLRLFASQLRATIAHQTARTYVDTLAQRSAPGLGAPKKLWWAKEITPDYHVAGRLSERQIKYAADGGFKSIVSLYHYAEPSKIGDEYLPTSEESAEIAKISGLAHRVVLEPGNSDWTSVDAVNKLSEIIPTLEKPILLHCHRAYTISFVTMMHMANASKYDPNYSPKVDVQKFYKMAALMGIDFTMDATRKTAAEITGETVPETVPTPNVVPKVWYDYWMAHPVYKNWYTAGQIRESHLEKLKMDGFIHIINMRMGVDDENGNPSQEQVTLINVKDGTPTYGNKETGPRQIPDTLKGLVLDSRKDNGFIAEGSDVNYEARNAGEFGDDIGYNEERERQVLEKEGFQYYHMPVYFF